MATTDVNVADATPKSRKLPPEVNIFFVLIGIALLFEVLGWVFQGQSFLGNFARLKIMILQVSVLGIISVGVTQIIITGGIDLSSGSLVAAVSMVSMSFAQTSEYGLDRVLYPAFVDLPVIIPIVVGLVVGACAGFINGWLIAYTKIPPFIATLGMMVSARGFAKWYTEGKPISFPTDSFARIGEGMNPVIIFIIVAIIFHIMMKYTRYGKFTYALGANETAARVSGINVERQKVKIYMIAGTLSALAAIVVCSRGQTAQPGMGLMYELDAIAMAVIGGTSLAGGRGSIIGTAIGMVILGVILSGFTFLRLDAYYQEMMKGAIIVGAVIIDTYRQKKKV
ncbi:ABC transporter permease [Tropicimonas sp. TH_r6]|uniref:ABC transporter permease n=1 Tax=Tropicimonas sp. TH_r6 TaxID=3082085 RepID=UPI002953CB8F|nr:ABC transporter permease [Tropicimonas sp. TH_r6]MDV7143360.1 ABC transporter permease [Tropicimonas sp. TH_r6]